MAALASHEERLERLRFTGGGRLSLHLRCDLVRLLEYDSIG